MSKFAYLFDVDGVLTDPQSKKITDKSIFDLIVAKLKNWEPVALNSGRSTKWMNERIIKPLISIVRDRRILAKFMAVGEKGGTWITFNESGSMRYRTDQNLTVPKDLENKIRKLVEQKYSESMFFDKTKETMISIEMHDNYEISEFEKQQALLIKDLERILTEKNMHEKLKIDPSVIATDVQHIRANKALGAVRFLQFLKEQDINPKLFKTFGDSPADFEMVDELDRRNKLVDFIYVGNLSKLGRVKKSYKVEFIGGFNLGTVQYLNKIKE